MDSNLVKKSGRGEKMLSMIGIRLEKIGQPGQDPHCHWKVSSLSGISNPQLDINKSDCDVFADNGSIIDHDKPASSSMMEGEDGVCNKENDANDDMDNISQIDNDDNVDITAQPASSSMMEGEGK
ncbi:unnamed protein product [Ceutorhynchus assimilis]|uniref:Uncharacterized protein n=1 Tax=Ceutorhynchus assimilis TaxID=467358 RepID=A0A9N9QHZ8_9CUCU|nr:unnamed protein product [Ceutorhynchus assimilis]CAG9773200.1 unnamed protein product [Ceutorhynchus assimilis]CAG9773367.1 unnamed protein product [Ceutorhynchus assimilis]